MSLQSVSGIATFDITDGAQQRDISPVLVEAIFFDLNFLSEGLVVADGDPVYDTKFWWDVDSLNSLSVTVNGSLASDGTTVNVDSGQGSRVNTGDLLYNTLKGSQELIEVTGISTDALTVTRGYGSTTQASIADNATLKIIRREQEASDIGTDRSVVPTVEYNFSHIFGANDIKVSGSQLARRMATRELQNWVAHQLANRAIEMKFTMSRAFLYSARSSDAGSDTAYRSLGGLRWWILNKSGIVSSATESLSYTILNTQNKSAVDLGAYNDTLLVGTDLVGSIAGINSTERRMLESDRVVGQVVQEVVLNHGNSVRVVVDAHVNSGDGFMYKAGNVQAKPLNDRGMFVIAATDFTDGKKRRILGEWTMKVEHPETFVYLANKA